MALFFCNIQYFYGSYSFVNFLKITAEVGKGLCL